MLPSLFSHTQEYILSFYKVIILAIIQGLTEFLPISSSGHLALAEHLLNFNPAGVSLEVVLHAGTLLTILIYYRKRLIEMAAKTIKGDLPTILYISMIALASIPAIALYILAGDKIEGFSDNPLLVSGFLCITGLIMLSTLLCKSNTTTKIGPLHAILIGLAQAFALFPGISRSGSTIVTARHLKIPTDKAAEFSFFMAIPALAGAVILKLPEIMKNDLDCSAIALIAGMVTSCLVGLAAIGILMRLIKKGHFWYFGIYCLIIGVAGLLLLK
jgi:undecaprenyl-diphosphatase